MMKALPIAAVFACTAGIAMAGNGFTLTSRWDVTAFPAVVVQGNSTGVTAFDILPKGNPTENADNGMAWNDTCNADLIANPNAPINCARFGAFVSKIVVGQRAFGGAAHVPLHIIQGNGVRIEIANGVTNIIGELRVNGTKVGP